MPLSASCVKIRTMSSSEQNFSAAAGACRH
jgi:hypothetical protein